MSALYASVRHMMILSRENEMVAYLPTVVVRWTKGSHTANVFGEGGEVDVFTFGWEKNNPNQLDFTTALQSWMEYLNE